MAPSNHRRWSWLLIVCGASTPDSLTCIHPLSSPSLVAARVPARGGDRRRGRRNKSSGYIMVGRPGEEGKSGDGDGRWVAWRALAVQGAVRPCLGRGRHGRSFVRRRPVCGESGALLEKRKKEPRKKKEGMVHFHFYPSNLLPHRTHQVPCGSTPFPNFHASQQPPAVAINLTTAGACGIFASYIYSLCYVATSQ